MAKRIVHTVTDLDTPVTLTKTGKDSFTVTYGLDVKKGLTYSEAARRYGLCIMHSAGCVGLLDD